MKIIRITDETIVMANSLVKVCLVENKFSTYIKETYCGDTQTIKQNHKAYYIVIETVRGDIELFKEEKLPKRKLLRIINTIQDFLIDDNSILDLRKEDF